MIVLEKWALQEEFKALLVGKKLDKLYEKILIKLYKKLLNKKLNQVKVLDLEI